MNFKDFYETAKPATQSSQMIASKHQKEIPLSQINSSEMQSPEIEKVIMFVSGPKMDKKYMLGIKCSSDEKTWIGYEIPINQIPKQLSVDKIDDNTPRPESKTSTFMGRKILWFYFHNNGVNPSRSKKVQYAPLMGAKVMESQAEGNIQ